MKRDHVDTLRRLAEAFGRGDFDGALEGFAPDVVVRPAIEGIDTERVYRGRDELRAFWEQITDTWDSQAIELVETIDAAPDQVIAVERWRMRGRDGIAVDFEIVDVYTFRDGLVARIDGYRTTEEALAAVSGGGAGMRE